MLQQNVHQKTDLLEARTRLKGNVKRAGEKDGRPLPHAANPTMNPMGA